MKQKQNLMFNSHIVHFLTACLTSLVQEEVWIHHQVTFDCQFWTRFKMIKVYSSSSMSQSSLSDSFCFLFHSFVLLSQHCDGLRDLGAYKFFFFFLSLKWLDAVKNSVSNTGSCFTVNQINMNKIHLSHGVNSKLLNALLFTITQLKFNPLCKTMLLLLQRTSYSCVSMNRLLKVENYM